MSLLSQRSHRCARSTTRGVHNERESSPPRARACGSLIRPSTASCQPQAQPSAVVVTFSLRHQLSCVLVKLFVCTDNSRSLHRTNLGTKNNCSHSQSEHGCHELPEAFAPHACYYRASIWSDPSMISLEDNGCFCT